MSFPDWGDVPTWGLFAGAVVTAIYAKRAFSKQSKEVGDQAEMLKVQGGQLEAMKQISEKQGAQLEEMQKTTAEQLTVLKLQADELRASLAEREREVSERHRAQAAQVFITEDKDPGQHVSQGVSWSPNIRARVHNTSEQPVYDAEFLWHRGSAGDGEPNPEPLGTILPGTAVAKVRKVPADTNMDASGAVVRFRDANNIRWLRRPDGELTEQQQ